MAVADVMYGLIAYRGLCGADLVDRPLPVHLVRAHVDEPLDPEHLQHRRSVSPNHNANARPMTLLHVYSI
jgi:hypothetical protein